MALVQVKIPLRADAVVSRSPLHLDVSLTRLQAMTLRRVRDELAAQRARLPAPLGRERGRRVWSSEDAVRWIVERIADAADARTPPSGGRNRR